MPDLTRRPIRSRIEAAILDLAAGSVHAEYGARKAAEIGSMLGTVVELGPGTGVNMRYYAPGTKVIGIEPNPVMHPRLRARAVEHDVDLEIRTGGGEAVDLADDSADGVVATFVLCGVDDQHDVLREVRRILKPGGRLFFVEHVAAPTGTWTRRVQRLVRRPHRWMFNGCRVDRDTAATLRAAGFAHVEIEPTDAGWRGLYVRYRIVGTAR